MARIPSPRNSSPSPSLRSWTSRANDRSAMSRLRAATESNGAGRYNIYETFQCVLQRAGTPAQQSLRRKPVSTARDSLDTENRYSAEKRGKKAQCVALSCGCFRFKVSVCTVSAVHARAKSSAPSTGGSQIRGVKHVQCHASSGLSDERWLAWNATAAAALCRGGRRQYAQHRLQRQPAVV